MTYNQLDRASDNFDRLPRECLARNVVDDSPILIRRGHSGYYPVHPATNVEVFNAERGITDEQVEAMMSGSMFGWHVPAADPDTWQRGPEHRTAPLNQAHQQ